MSSYIRSDEWEQVKQTENWDEYYDALEEQDKVKSHKRQTKLRDYEGYENGGD